MQVIESVAEGLKREVEIIIPSDHFMANLNQRLQDLKNKVNIKGFRPGKVPVSYLKKMYGKSILEDVINEVVRDKTSAVLSERGEKPATQPDVKLIKEEDAFKGLLEGTSDLKFILSYEVMPLVEIQPFDDFHIVREVCEVDEQEVNEQMLKIIKNNLVYKEKAGVSEIGDQITMDYRAKIDDEDFKDGPQEGLQLVLGAEKSNFEFENKLLGVKAGENKIFDVTFPEDYLDKAVAGKKVVFDVTVKKVSFPVLNEEKSALASRLGFETEEQLKEFVHKKLKEQYESVSRQKIKRQIFDYFDNRYKLEIPQRLVDIEFKSIIEQVQHSNSGSHEHEHAHGALDDKEREEYYKLAERRVRLGIILGVIGENTNIEIKEDEIKSALYEQLQKFPGQEKKILNYYRSSPEALSSLRAPIFEEKVVDYLLGKINVTDKLVTSDQLLDKI
ncbi:Cell division trigger factor [Liberibacter crescens BT-1]|uniref:Trigger factor n=1 Tax=Liberibacter crescens (strain BT-1) TaxID=1215343 RepID=L0EVR0_LIBCB|nr:trigger factor [Liberibacter crescens]AGA65017.1 Cell division trigger factor [Liberibacter crescens BT-1]